MPADYLPVIVLMLAAVGFALTPLLLAWLWAKKFLSQQAGQGQECDLRMRFGVAGGRVDTIQIRVLPLRDYLPDF